MFAQYIVCDFALPFPGLSPFPGFIVIVLNTLLLPTGKKDSPHCEYIHYLIIILPSNLQCTSLYMFQKLK